MKDRHLQDVHQDQIVVKADWQSNHGFVSIKNPAIHQFDGHYVPTRIEVRGRLKARDGDNSALYSFGFDGQSKSQVPSKILGTLRPKLETATRSTDSKSKPWSSRFERNIQKF